MSSDKVMWTPSKELTDTCALTRFMRQLSVAGLCHTQDISELHRWSLQEPQRFWSEVARFVGLVGSGSAEPAYDTHGFLPTPLARRWFPNFSLNFAENLLQGDADTTAIISWSEDKVARSVSFGQLRKEAAAISEYLRRLGIVAGDKVFAYLPNIPESVACMLGSAALGALWSSCGTDYQLQGILSRMERVNPSVFFAATGYVWRGAVLSLEETIREVVERVPSIKHVVLVECAAAQNRSSSVAPALPDRVSKAVFSTIVQQGALEAPEYERLPFNHPLYVMFSSGTTGRPKGIVHSAGGTLLEHKKELMLHSDLRPGDRLFYQTSTSWMMWNWCVSALACGATVVMYDGDPMIESGSILWRLVDTEQVTHFGTSAAFLGASQKQGVVPKEVGALKHLRTILSTGSTLYPAQFEYVAEKIKPIWIQSISGGTDIIGCFGLGSPLQPVVCGEVQAKSLGYDVCVYNDRAERVIGEEGELICAAPAPSMPIYFLDDPEGKAYRNAYFADFPGVWRHGDFLKETRHGGLWFLGRSDATLKPAGVRVATADVYSALAAVSEVHQALAVGYTPSGSVSERIVLFVVLGEGQFLDEALQQKIKSTLRAANAFYVPALILQAPEVPRTTNNKLSELSVKRVLRGEEPGNLSALANPTSIQFFATQGRESVLRALEGR